MGGRATGPRLNRHAPQQDAHDPTQFEQRTRISAPHPVFGRGGVAMPGMVVTGKAFPSTEKAHTPDTPALMSLTSDNRDRRISTPPASSGYSAQAGRRSTSPQKAGRERTISTPSGTSLSSPVTQNELPSKSINLVSAYQTPPAKIRSNTLTQAARNGENVSTYASSSPPASRPFTPRQQLSTVSPPPSKSPITTPSLARPIQPDARASPSAPQLPTSQSPSPAFLRPPSQKDPTPSLSRLQGRGFVQNMVKVSAQLETPTPSPPGSSEKPRSSSRKSSVLDRWQPTTSTSPSPPPSPRPIPVRKSLTTDPMSTSSTIPSPKSPVGIPGPLRAATSLPSITSKQTASPSEINPPTQYNMPPKHTPGLGSATTLIVFQPTRKDPTPPATVSADEMGVKNNSAGREREVPTRSAQRDSAAQSGTPLIHVRSFW